MSQTSSLFPLPLSPIELCWLFEDSPSHPMQFFLRIEINGHLERPSFEKGLQKTIARHPLFTAIVEKISRTKWQWIEGPKEALPVEWLSGSIEDLPALPPIDIYKERGIRVFVIESKQKASTIILQFQHTVCDGIGASEFSGDLLTAYAQQINPEQTVKYKKLNPDKLVNRANSELSQAKKIAWYLKRIRSLSSIRAFYKKKPLLLINRSLPKQTEADPHTPEGLYCRYDRQQSVAINQRAREKGNNLNSQLLTLMYTSFLNWRKDIEQKQAADSDLYRVTTPLSMRTAAHRSIPAANMVSLVCFDRTIEETKDSKALQQSIETELEHIQNEHIGLALPATIRLMSNWPIQLHKAIKRKQFSGTTLLSNLGPILTTCLLPKEQGKIRLTNDLLVEHADFLAVIRPGHCATMAASTYAGKLTLGLHYDSRIITSDEANLLFTHYTNSLNN